MPAAQEQTEPVRTVGAEQRLQMPELQEVQLGVIESQLTQKMPVEYPVQMQVPELKVNPLAVSQFVHAEAVQSRQPGGQARQLEPEG